MSAVGDILKALRPNRTNRFRVVLLCVAAATTFWFLNAMNKQHTTTMNYPVRFVYDDQRYIEVEKLPETVAINVNGLGWNLLRNSLGIKTSPLLIPLENPAGIKSLSGLSLPSLISDQIDEFQLNYVLTDTLYINLDERSSRTFRLMVDSAALPLREGFRISSPVRVAPDSVVLGGPKRYLEQLSDTIFLDLNEDRIDQTFNANISVPRPQKVTTVDPPIVQVAFNVNEYIDEEVSVPLKLIRPAAEPADTIRSGQSVRVRYTIERERADEIGPEDFTMIASLTNMSEDSTVIPRLSYYPLGLIDLRYDSAEVRLNPDE